LHDHDKITLNGLKDHSKTKYCSHQTDFLETEVHQYLDSSFEERKDEDETNNVTEHLLNHTFEVDDCENLARNKADNFVNVLHDSNQHLLRNPERLHELKKADQIMVCIKKLKLAREILKKISAFDLCLKPARRPIAKQGKIKAFKNGINYSLIYFYPQKIQIGQKYRILLSFQCQTAEKQVAVA